LIPISILFLLSLQLYRNRDSGRSGSDSIDPRPALVSIDFTARADGSRT
jgi:hypothetical protein